MINIKIIGVGLILAVQSLVVAQNIPVAPPASELPAKSDLIEWPLADYPSFAKKSIGNLQSWLLDAPAGKHGHVEIQSNGQLRFADGTPANFWGTTTVYAMTFPVSKSDISYLAEAIAARGYNAVRFHHNDTAKRGMGYLQTTPKSNYLLDKYGMDRLDFFAAELIKRGVYIYLGIVDYRSFKAEDGMADYKALNRLGNHGWKGVFPHPAMTVAWKRSVKQLLQHKNPYTGRTWAEEPAVITIEIINENGLFWDWDFKLTPRLLKWREKQWNSWLLNKYGNRQKLSQAWTDYSGTKGLFNNEDPVKGNVFKPPLAKIDEWSRSYRSKTSGAARVNDYYEYLSESMINFYKEAKLNLRELGFKGVVIGSHELRGPLNRFTEYKGTGVVAAHLYGGNLIAWNARPGVSGVTINGVDVAANNWFSNMFRVKVKGAPGINGEWTSGGAVYRADGNLAVAATTAFQRLTQSCHFSYGHRWRGEDMACFDNLFEYKAYQKTIKRSFSYHHEIPWMMVNRICAPMFIRRDFAKPKHTVAIAYSKVDLYEQNLHALGSNGGGGTIGNAANFLSIMHNVRSDFFDKEYTGDADVVFMTGRSSSGDYSQAQHAVLIGDNPFKDVNHKQRDIGYVAKQVHPTVNVVNLKTPVEFTCNWPWKNKRVLKFASLEGAVKINSIPSGARPIGKSKDGKYTLGWLDDRFLVLPAGRAFDKTVADCQWLYKFYLAACKRWGISTGKNSSDASYISSDTGEFVVDWGFGSIQIDTVKTQGFSGVIGWRKANKTKNLECEIKNPYANVLATAADNLPLGKSRKILLVAVGRMQNTGQQVKNGKVVKVGDYPCLVECIRGKVSLQNNNAGKLIVYALDHTGKRLGVVKSRYNAGNKSIDFELSPVWASVWFEITTQKVKIARNKKWPLPPRKAPVFQQPKEISLANYLKIMNVAIKKNAKPTERKTVSYSKNIIADFSEKSGIYTYGNTKKSSGNVIQFGKVNQQWHGGAWANMAPSGIASGTEIVGIGLDFQGDGTRPRDTFFYVVTGNGVKYVTGNINKIFEDDSRRDIIFTPNQFKIDPSFLKQKKAKATDFPVKPDLAKVKRIDLVCVGPLMNQSSTGTLFKAFIATEKKVNDSTRGLPKPMVPVSKKLAIPFIKGALITADGNAKEHLWKQAAALTMNEDKIPEWHFFGSHIVSGKRTKNQQADFWLAGTAKGLALLCKIKTGNASVVAEDDEWWKNDCLEIFTDPKNRNMKPARQLFLAYQRKGRDQAAASDKAIEIGRSYIADGYILEALIPWKSMGFNGIPRKTFGLEFQIDFAEKGKNRILQLCYGTGTNSAWTDTKYYLKVKLTKKPKGGK